MYISMCSSNNSSVIFNETQNMCDCEGAADLWSVPAALAYPAHTCTFYTCPLLWLPGYGMESKATVSELGVFNLPQSLRACASAHVIHHVDQNMPQTNGASALCRSRRAVTAGQWELSLRPPAVQSEGDPAIAEIRHFERPLAVLLDWRLLFCWVSERPRETPRSSRERSCRDKPKNSGKHGKRKCGKIELQ